MEEQRADPKTRAWRRRIAIVVLVCGAVAGGFVLGNRVWRQRQPESMPFMLLQFSNPIHLEIDLTLDPPKEVAEIKWASGEPFREAQGTARYTFTNWSKARVKVAFPPAHAFYYGADWMRHDEASLPFASRTFELDLAPGESKSFAEPYSVAPVHDSLLRGGPGTVAFVFDAPRPELRKEYCVGTVFGHYSASIRKPSENE